MCSTFCISWHGLKQWTHLFCSLIFNSGTVHQGKKALVCSTRHQWALIRGLTWGSQLEYLDAAWASSHHNGWAPGVNILNELWESHIRLLWHSYWSHSVCSASFSLLRQSRSSDQIQGEENRLFLFMVEWQGSRRVYGTRNSAVATFGKYSMPQGAWKNNFETFFFFLPANVFNIPSHLKVGRVQILCWSGFPLRILKAFLFCLYIGFCCQDVQCHFDFYPL